MKLRTSIAIAFFGILGAVVIAMPLSPSDAHPIAGDPNGHVHVNGTVPGPHSCGTYIRGAEDNGYQTNPSTYDYTIPSPMGFAAGNSPDHHWVHDVAKADDDFMVWDMGNPTAVVDLFPSIDHGPIPGESFEVTIYGTNDLSAPEATWEIADMTTVYDEGFDASWISDDYVSRWVFTTPYRYVGVHWGGSRAEVADGDAEIDAVCAPLGQGNPRVVQTDCDTLSTSPPLVRVTFAVINLGPIPVCSVHLTPIQSGPTPADSCRILECSTPPGWQCALDPAGGAVWRIDPSQPPGCIQQGNKHEPFDVLLDPLFCCYRVEFDDENGRIFADDIVCFECQKPTPAQKSTWGSLKSKYR